jgi:molecular chaperone Hsp33
MAGAGDFRVIAVEATRAVEAVRRRNDMSPVAAIALGRAMAGAVLLARLLDKSPHAHQVTLRIEGDGPLGLIIAEANTAGTVRGFVANPRPSIDSLEVGEAVGRNGTLMVVRAALPTGRPYASQIRLVTGEIARDLSEYLLVSEQISTAVLLGVQLSQTGVEAAGGMVVQRFPHATEKQAEMIESLIEDAPPFSSLLAKMPIDDAVAELLRGTDYRPLDSSFDVPIEFRCSCTRARALAPYALLAPDELQEMIEKEGGSRATCQFCGEVYQFTPEELRDLAGGRK